MKGRARGRGRGRASTQGSARRPGKAQETVSMTQGLMNISDKVILTLDILLELRELFKRGVPMSIAVEAKIEVLLQKTSKDEPTLAELDYIKDLMYNGFYCFEAISERTLDSVICGICGTIGELYLGDGNEKNCCSTSKICYDSDRDHFKGHPLTLEDFMAKVRLHWIECVTYTRTSTPFAVHAAEVPPMIAPALRGNKVWNTELQKKSIFLKDLSTAPEGDPAILHTLIRSGKLNMENISNMNAATLTDSCKQCGISVANKTLGYMRIKLQTLYASLLVGNCPCHGFTHVPGHTGGFYHMVCRHGCTVASKFLLLQESVRDAADLYLSLKYPPPVLVCDTPCGFARHMDCRVPDVTDKLWGVYGGCFEPPSLEQPPTMGIDVPIIVPAEYKADEEASSPHPGEAAAAGEWTHPMTGTSRRFVLGDRFHNASEPHKSKLCRYHDIDLCSQADALKTSYQESMNHSKNSKRLRSACVQGFGVHYFYNYLMDYYQNEGIIKQQYKELQKSVKEADTITKDEYFRFKIVKNDI